MKKLKHGWNTKENYFLVHHRVLKKFQWCFVGEVKYQHTVYTDQWEELLIEKALVKTEKDNLVEIKIRKDIEIEVLWGKSRARTFSYSYQVKNPKSKQIYWRYDSPHEHRLFHHKHIFNESTQKIVSISKDEWPHVSEFLQEVISSF